MKKLYIICLFLLCGLAATAQDFEIVSVEYLENSLQAVKDKVTESGSQGRDCALLRIAMQDLTPQQCESFDFSTDMGSNVERRADRDGEIWLWVTPGVRHMVIRNSLLGGNRELHFLEYGVKIQSLKTYKVVIRGTEKIDDTQTGSHKETPNRLHDAASPEAPMDLEQCGFRVEIIKAHPYTTLLPWDGYSDKSIKKQARSMRKQGWELQDSNRTMEEAMERIFSAGYDENVVVLTEKVKASKLEQGWHNAYSLAVLEYLGYDNSLKRFTKWFEGDYETYVNALGDKFTVIGTSDHSVEAYKYDSEGLTYIVIKKPSERDDSEAKSLFENNLFLGYDFESVEKAKRVVASGDSFTFFRKQKDSETGQTTYEIETVFIVELPQVQP